MLGVSVTEKPPMTSDDILIMAYYSLSLFVVGGVDLGTPIGGPNIARAFVWMAYFGAPILAATTLIDVLLRALAPQSWELKRLRGHVVVVGPGELCLSYLRVLRKHNPSVPVLVVCREIEQSAEDEIRQSFDAKVVIGDITHKFFLSQLKLKRAAKILLLCEDSLRSYEAASIITTQVPNIGHKVIVHCGNLRFMRAMMSTRVAQECQTFNTYHLAASGLVRTHLMKQFEETKPKDIVVLAGFGRFGQTILEELQARALDEMDTVVIIDTDAHRRILVADEQMAFKRDYRLVLIDGDISHPETWTEVRQAVELNSPDTVVVLGTGREEDNLRTALWLKQKNPKAKIFSRSSKESEFATEVAQEKDIIGISITQLVEENIPLDWVQV
ncbi:MAG: NAD-binding protein [Pseudomonadales bacterium]